MCVCVCSRVDNMWGSKNRRWGERERGEEQRRETIYGGMALILKYTALHSLLGKERLRELELYVCIVPSLSPPPSVSGGVMLCRMEDV